MSKTPTEIDLEKRIAELERRIATLEARPVVVPTIFPPIKNPLEPPYTITCNNL